MNVDWSAFTPWSALAGGALIGLAAALLALGLGRVAGISGILGQLLAERPTRAGAWRLFFLLGLLATAGIGALLGLPVAGEAPALREGAAAWAVPLVAGLLVGFGSRLGGGCTSGHGVSGLARLSPRSLAAVAGFMGTGFVTVFVVRHLLGG